MLRLGKIKENTLKRSVLKEIKSQNSDLLIGPEIGEDAACLSIDDSVIAVTTNVVTIPCENVGELLVIKSVNNLLAQGAEPICINLSVLLPETEDEKTLKSIIRDVEKTASQYKMQIAGGHTEVTGAVVNPIITGTAIGKIKSKGPIKTGGVKPGNEIVLTKWIGLEGTSIIARRNRERLYKLFPASFVEAACDFGNYTCIAEEAAIAYEYGVSSMTDVSSGGIFAALWEMAEASGVGFDIDLMAIPVRQETIEICEIYGINPYQIISGGALLLACDNGEKLVELLEKADLPAVVIGSANASSNRLIHNGEEVRFMDMPMTDEILKIFE